MYHQLWPLFRRPSRRHTSPRSRYVRAVPGYDAKLQIDYLSLILPGVKPRIKNKPSLHGFGAGVLCWLPQSLTRQPPQGGGLGVSDISQGIQQTRGAREQRAHIESERRAKAVKKNTRAAIWRTLQFPRAGMTVFFRLLNAATSSFGSRVQTLVVRVGKESRGPREGESKPPPWSSGPAERSTGRPDRQREKPNALRLIFDRIPPTAHSGTPAACGRAPMGLQTQNFFKHKTLAPR